jgi:RNA polymerase sigma-70 factor (ECF subfamily)
MSSTPSQLYGCEVRPPIPTLQAVYVAEGFSSWEVRRLNQENQAAPAPACDVDLVTRAQRGEANAFEALFHAHQRRVYHLCLRMIGNTAEAEELTQDAFVQLFRKIHTFRGESAFATWLHRLSVNLVLMRLRKKTVKEITVESNDNEQSERPRKEFGAPDPALAGLVDRVCLKRAVAKLPQGCRQVFMFHDVLGHEHHEIAEMLGCSVGNSKSQLHKARMRLRKLLGSVLRKDARRKKVPNIAWFVESLRDSRPACNVCPSK